MCLIGRSVPIITISATPESKSMLQLNPPIPIVTPKGHALAHVLIDYSPEYDLLWVCFQDNGECWTWNNKEIRADQNISLGRIIPKNDK